MRQVRTSIIIHGFALLHVAGAILCRLGGISDDLFTFPRSLYADYTYVDKQQ